MFVLFLVPSPSGVVGVAKMLTAGQDLAPCTVLVALHCCGTQGLPAVWYIDLGYQRLVN